MARNVKKARRVRTQYPRVYEVLAGPFEGANGSWYVVRDEDNNMIEMKRTALIDKLEEV
jgi:hypothetical protein